MLTHPSLVPACLPVCLSNHTTTNLVPWSTCPGVIWRLVFPAIGRLFRTGFDLIYLASLASCTAFGARQAVADQTSRPSSLPALKGSSRLTSCTPRSCRHGNAADDQRQKCSTGLVFIEPISSMTLPLLHVHPCSCSSRTATCTCTCTCACACACACVSSASASAPSLGLSPWAAAGCISQYCACHNLICSADRTGQDRRPVVTMNPQHNLPLPPGCHAALDGPQLTSTYPRVPRSSSVM
ncbi:hypothetical protein F5883DRAFT_160115 [Diaporthe sp. PMI_573]|nr:hypothetical protein F5883DRAFT_160115 [Diaporthaceae sp. PMI_573]